MIDPVSLAAMGAIKGACDLALGATVQLVPLVHDEVTRKRLHRLSSLLLKIRSHAFTASDLDEALSLHGKLHTDALMAKNDLMLEYLSEIATRLESIQSTYAASSEEAADLLSFDRTTKTPSSSIEMLKEELIDIPVPAPPLNYSTVRTPSTMSGEDLHSSSQETKNQQKRHAKLKKVACWTLVLTVGPLPLLSPQVRRNLKS